MRFPRNNWSTLASGGVLAVVSATLVVFAFSSTGFPVVHADLNDGGVWVSSNHDNRIARVNKPAGTMDAAVSSPGGAPSPTDNFDVLQDGSAVVGWNQGAGKLFAVDVHSAVAAGDGATVGSPDQVALAGGSLAVLDPGTGKLWTTRVDPTGGITSLGSADPAGKPAASLGAVVGAHQSGAVLAGLAVGTDGTVYAVSAAGKVITIKQLGAGFARPVTSQLGSSLQSVQVTAVGDQLVVLDPLAGRVVLPGGKPVDLPAGVAGADAVVLQEAGPGASTVLVATEKSLDSISLSDGKVTSLYESGTGKPAAPVLLSGCVHAAWAGSPGVYARSCDGGTAKPLDLKGMQVLTHPVFRVNRASILLNDVDNGRVWDVDSGHEVDAWDNVLPQKANHASKNKSTDQSSAPLTTPPKPQDDTWGARPGRTTILHLLDNDADPGGHLLVITRVAGLDTPAAQLSIAPDGQTVEITMPAPSQDIHFKYYVDDGYHSAAANVTVKVRGPGDNEHPAEPKPGQDPKLTVVSGGSISVPVLGDWRDFDGDPLVVTDASVEGKAGSVTTTPDGRVVFQAPVTGGLAKITYNVTDRIAALIPHTFTIAVIAPTALKGMPSIAAPDVATGQVNNPIVVQPLANDLPGADPATRRVASRPYECCERGRRGEHVHRLVAPPPDRRSCRDRIVSGQGSGHLILIVEDNAMNLKLARDVLRFNGFRTLEATSGEDALPMAREDLPDLVLMDIALPGMDGVEAARRLRAAPETAAIPIVALTASVMETDRARFVEAGFAGLIAKPINVLRFPEQVLAYCPHLAEES